MNRTFVQIGASLAFLGVALGAFGAHALKEQLGSNRPVWETAVQYQMVHALGLILAGVLAGQMGSKKLVWTGWLFVVGVIVFSGSLYALALSDVRILGAITPLGGVCFLAGWVMFALAAAEKPTVS